MGRAEACKDASQAPREPSAATAAHPVMKVCVIMAALATEAKATPHAARPAITPLPDSPASAATRKRKSLPHSEAVDQSVRPTPAGSSRAECVGAGAQAAHVAKPPDLPP